MRFSKIILSLSGLVLLSGCYAMQGTPQIINSGGVVNQVGEVKSKSENLKGNFRYAVDQAVKDEHWGNINEVLDTGFLLVYSNCDDFFREMGTRQRDSNIARDMLSPIVSILTGVISLKDFQNAGRQQDYIEGLGLGSAAFLTALDIHDRHFLFGTENIFEVRKLIADGLDSNERAVRNLGEMNFEGAVKQLMRHQGVCTPAGIKYYVKEAISKSKIVASPYIGTGLGSDSQDTLALDGLGTSVGMAGETTIDQAGALWWLYLGQAAHQEELKIINEKLKGLPKQPVPFAGGAGSYTFTRGVLDDDAVKTALRKFPMARLDAFKATRDEYVNDPKYRQSPGPGEPSFQWPSNADYSLEIAR